MRFRCRSPTASTQNRSQRDPWRANEEARRRQLREDANRPLAVNLAEGLALSEFLSTFTGSAQAQLSPTRCVCASCWSGWSRRRFVSCSSAALRSMPGGTCAPPMTSTSFLIPTAREPRNARRPPAGSWGEGRRRWRLLDSDAISTFLRTGDRTLVRTDLGQVDVLQGLPQFPRYAELEAEAKDVDIDGLTVRVCSLEHLLEMKRASERPRDRDDLEALEAAQERGDRGLTAAALPFRDSIPGRELDELPEPASSMETITSEQPTVPAEPTPARGRARACRAARRCGRRSRPGGRRSGSKTSSSSPGCSSPASSTRPHDVLRGDRHLRRLLPDLQRRLLRQRPDRRRARPQAPEEALPAAGGGRALGGGGEGDRAGARRWSRSRSPSHRQLGSRPDGRRLRDRPDRLQPRPQADRDHRRDDAGGALHPPRRRRRQSPSTPTPPSGCCSAPACSPPSSASPSAARRPSPSCTKAPPAARSSSTTRCPSSTRWSPWSPPAP